MGGGCSECRWKWQSSGWAGRSRTHTHPYSRPCPPPDDRPLQDHQDGRRHSPHDRQPHCNPSQSQRASPRHRLSSRPTRSGASLPAPAQCLHHLHITNSDVVETCELNPSQYPTFSAEDGTPGRDRGVCGLQAVGGGPVEGWARQAWSRTHSPALGADDGCRVGRVVPADGLAELQTGMPTTGGMTGLLFRGRW